MRRRRKRERAARGGWRH
ncbi:hypothetical protein [Caulifigura coniformis]